MAARAVRTSEILAVTDSWSWPSPAGELAYGPYECPCCRYPILREPHAYWICALCWWEGDGQDDEDADFVRSGPNYDYSLTEARQNFSRHLTQYRPSDEKFVRFRQADQAVLACKRRIIEAFEEMRSNPDQDTVLRLWTAAAHDLSQLRLLEGLR